MKRIWFHTAILALLIVLLFLWTFFFASTSNVVLARQTTGMFITVITEEPKINVRMGPSSSIYPIVGSLLQGATAPALGRSAGGDWIQIEYPGAPYDKGWVYSPLVLVSPGTLLVVEPPPTPAQPPTATIDPTLAAQFTIIPTNTRLPTFTPAPSFVAPNFTEAPAQSADNSVPLAVIIIAFVVLGLLGFLVSLVIVRR